MSSTTLDDEAIAELTLDRALKDFEIHFLHERNHQGIGNELIEPGPRAAVGTVHRRERLGGLLNYYYPSAA